MAIQFHMMFMYFLSVILLFDVYFKSLKAFLMEQKYLTCVIAFQVSNATCDVDMFTLCCLHAQFPIQLRNFSFDAERNTNEILQIDGSTGTNIWL